MSGPRSEPPLTPGTVQAEDAEPRITPALPDEPAPSRGDWWSLCVLLGAFGVLFAFALADLARGLVQLWHKPPTQP